MGDEHYYLVATNEVEEGTVHQALWAKAETLASGDPKGAKFEYIRLRVLDLKKSKSDKSSVQQSNRDDRQEASTQPHARNVGPTAQKVSGAPAADQTSLNRVGTESVKNELGLWWWCIWGWLLLTIGNLMAFGLFAEFPGAGSAIIATNTIVAFFVLRLNKWAFLFSTLYVGNPLIWILNGVYLRRRWNDPRINEPWDLAAEGGKK